LNIKILIRAAIDSITRHISRVKGKYKYNKIKEVIFAIIAIKYIVKYIIKYVIKYAVKYVVKYVIKYAVKYVVKYAVKCAVKYIVKFRLYYKTRRNISTFYLNIYSNLCS
jgi:hypothetical protein